MEPFADAPAPDPDHTTDTTLTDFRAATAAHWRTAFLEGDVTAVELATTALTAASAHSSLGAFLHLDADYALARAAETDAVRTTMVGASSGEDRDAALSRLSTRSPLLGLPTAFKDLVDVAGMPTTRGTAALPPAVAAKDHGLARRLHGAGAISVGKTQVPEFGLPCYSENQIAEPSRNPLDPDRTSGGSTGGGAAAVASGMLPLAPGTDGGGSVRIPAAACGLVGLKPGRTRLPDDDRSPAATNLPVSGPIADTVEDAALLFDVMAGHSFRVPEVTGSGSRNGPGGAGVVLAEGPAMRGVRQALETGLAPLNIGVTTESPFSPELEVTLQEGAVTALEKGIGGLEQAGHIVQGTSHCTGSDRFWPEDYHRLFRALWTARMGSMEFPPEQEEKLEPLTRYFLELARNRPGAETAEAVTRMQDFADSADEIFGPWDVLLTPMLAWAPPKVGWFAGLSPEENYIQQCRFTPYSSVVNVLGLPAINVPTHTDAAGLSWSVQIIGPTGSEEMLLALAAVLRREM
ncbi:amidase [Nesterenkonia cremea]|uniref:Amidase n=1 Tax=Nesterenkonia cremea TaxID=1882340 RepID=A0A917ELU9_9MICC|nr:amidase [Nesterenkonia cremea]GGE58623.1 amidase [Nesterenkonia cremea]